MIVIVPNDLRDSIYAKVDKALEPHPHLIDQRDEIYQQMLTYFDQHGTIPDFEIQLNEAPDEN